MGGEGLEPVHQDPMICGTSAHSEPCLVTESGTADSLTSFLTSLSAEQRVNLMKLLAGGSP